MHELVNDNFVISAALSQGKLLLAPLLITDVTPAAICFDNRNVVCVTWFFLDESGIQIEI